MRLLPVLIPWILPLLLEASGDPVADPSELPRIPPTEPADAPATFEIRPGFRLELAAHEPMVVDPIDIEFDEHGRLFTVEMRDYSERRDEALGRIRLLHDDDGDGFFDRSTVYAEGLQWPTSVCCWDGGVFVAASPDIFYFKDTDGDGVADTRELVFTGFGPEAGRLNMQALLNSLQWGPGNRIWGATAATGGLVRRPDQPKEEAINLRGADFSFDPRKRDLRPENGTAQYGMSFDSRGRRYVCSNSNHLVWVAWEREDAPANPWFRLPAPLVSIAPDGAAAPVFRISPDEPWRIVRTRWRVSGVVNGSVEGGGRVSGYFTSASGITIYTGDAFGPEFHDNAFVGDVGSNLVHRKILRDHSGRFQPVAVRAGDEEGTEFLRSRDNWFRPVNFANGPDGCLYICDMYRETIEHPWSIPEGIKQHLDLNSGWDRGRIWRVVPEGFERPAFDLKRDTGWHRVTRSRLAAEQGEPAMAAFLPAPGPGEDAGADDSWAVAFSLHRLRDPGAMAAAWEQRATRSAAWQDALAEMIGRTGDAAALQAVTTTLTATSVGPALSLANGLKAAKRALPDVIPADQLSALFATARRAASDPGTPLSTRLRALEFLAFDAGNESRPVILAILADPNGPESLRQAAVRVAAEHAGDLPAAVRRSWDDLSPQLRVAALDALARRPSDLAAFLGAVEDGTIPPGEIPANVAELWRQHREEEIRALAGRLLPAPELVPRETVVARYQTALTLPGEADRGRAVFNRAACATCHRALDGSGMAVGPDVATFKTAGADSLLKNLFDPNAEVAPQYQAFVFELAGAEALVGLIAREDATEVTVRMPGGLERAFPRKDVVSMKGAGASLMPEGLESVLTEQDVADLLAYIASSP